MLPNIKLRTALFGLMVRQMKQNEKSISIFLINVYQIVVTYSVTLNTINMALIKCTECGEMISDKATVCPHCGAPIEKMTKCEDCGAEYSADAEMCPNCGCPNPSKESQKQSSEQSNNEQKNVGISEERKKRVQDFLVENRQKLPQNKFNEIREILFNLTDEQWETIEYITFKDPTLLLVLSILVGEFGVDRFVLGDTTNGALKLLLTLCCGVGLIWWVIDIFQINRLTLDYNYKLLRETLSFV